MSWAGYLDEARTAIVGASDESGLEEARVRYLGRRSRLVEGLRSARELPVEERAELNRTKAELEQLVASRRAELEQTLITQIRREVEDVFLGLGYEIFDGPEVETAYYNFTALNTPEHHPSRSPGDTFYLSDDVLLRTQTSPGQVRFMETRSEE